MHNGNNIRRSAKARVWAVAIAFGVLAVAANATDPIPNDYSTQLGTFTTTIQSFFQTNGGPLLVALCSVLVFGIVWKLVKRVAKSV